VGFFSFVDCIVGQKASLDKNTFLSFGRLSSMQWHNSNRLPISADSWLWMCWIKSFCTWPSPDSHVWNRLYRSAKILRLLMRRFSYIRSTVFPCSFSFLFTWHPEKWVTLGKSSFIAGIGEESEHPLIMISSRRMRMPIFFMTSSGLNTNRTFGVFYFYCNLSAFHSNHIATWIHTHNNILTNYHNGL